MKCRIEPPVPESLERARKLIEREEVAAFPTETVYGLGGSALSERAILKIYEVKGRPQDNPLIVHTWSVDKVPEIGEVTPLAQKLMDAFMPGPITLVLKRRPEICARVSAGLDTVAVRVPGHGAAQAFLKAVGVPIAAPSANSSTRPSPTSATHVFADLGEKIELIIDGGDCEVGIESTVVDATGDRPRILRPGIVTREMIETVASVDDQKNSDHVIRSPGVKYKHYAPKCEVRLFHNGDVERIQGAFDASGNAVVLCGPETAAKLSAETVVLGQNEREVAHNFYRALLDAEKKYDLILLEACPEDDLGSSVNNRMFKTGGSRFEGDGE